MHDIVTDLITHIALVLDPSVPVTVVDVEGDLVDDLGDGMEAPDALVGVETLPIVGWIEEKKNIFLCFVQLHEELICRARLG